MTDHSYERQREKPGLTFARFMDGAPPVPKKTSTNAITITSIVASFKIV